MACEETTEHTLAAVEYLDRSGVISPGWNNLPGSQRALRRGHGNQIEGRPTQGDIVLGKPASHEAIWRGVQTEKTDRKTTAVTSCVNYHDPTVVREKTLDAYT